MQDSMDMSSQESSTPKEEFFDVHALYRLIADTDKETVGKVVEAFGASLKNSITAAKDEAAHGLHKNIAMSAHRLSSSSRVLGFNEFAALSSRINNFYSKNNHLRGMENEIIAWISLGEEVQMFLSSVSAESPFYSLRVN